MFGKDSRPEFRVGHHNPRGGVPPFVPRRAGIAERCSDKSFSILGQLVRFTAQIKARHPEVADSILHLMHQDGPPSLMAASRVAGELRGVSGFDPPSWQEANRARPQFHDFGRPRTRCGASWVAT